MKKVICSLLCFCIAFALHAQEKDTTQSKKPDITGYGGVYYKYSFNKNVTDNKTSFTSSNQSFEVGMLSLKIQHSFGKVGFTGDVGWGKRADDFSYTDEKSSVMLKQLFIDYSPVSWLKFTAGSFATFIGYELVDANLNRNYSMSYMFSFGPFSHTGIKAEATAGNHTFMLGIFNPTDYKYAPPGSKKYIGGQWQFHPEGIPFSSALGYIGGKDTAGIRTDQIDLVMNYIFSSHFSLGYNGTYSQSGGAVPDAAWWGSALYFNVDCNEDLGFTLRTEYFNDADNLKVFTDKSLFPEGGSIWAYTLSANYRIGPMTFIPEFRIDHASAPLFTKEGTPKHNTANILVAAVYSF